MLNKETIIKLGFVEKVKNKKTYYQKGQYILLPNGIGCWDWGVDGGTEGIPHNSISICTEEQLKEALKNAN